MGWGVWMTDYRMRRRYVSIYCFCFWFNVISLQEQNVWLLKNLMSQCINGKNNVKNMSMTDISDNHNPHYQSCWRWPCVRWHELYCIICRTTWATWVLKSCDMTPVAWWGDLNVQSVFYHFGILNQLLTVLLSTRDSNNSSKITWHYMITVHCWPIYS